MFPIAWPIPVFFFVILTAISFGVGIGLGVLINFILKVPYRNYLVSSGLVMMGGFLLTLAVLVFLPGTLSWVNEAPQNLRTVLWDYSILIAVCAGLVVAPPISSGL